MDINKILEERGKCIKEVNLGGLDKSVVDSCIDTLVEQILELVSPQ